MITPIKEKSLLFAFDKTEVKRGFIWENKTINFSFVYALLQILKNCKKEKKVSLADGYCS